MILPLLTFLAVSSGIVGLYSLFSDMFLQSEERVNERIDEEFRRQQKENLRRALTFKLPPTAGMDLNMPAGPITRVGGEKPPLWDRCQLFLDQAGIKATPGQVLLIAFLTSLSGAAPAYFFLGLLAGISAAAIAAAAPLLYINFRHGARMEALLAQLPDAFDLMARVIRAGHSVPQALQAVADEFEPPISREFAFCQEQQNLGLLPEITFRDLGRRAGVLEVKIFVMAMLIQRSTGGNLTDLLERISVLIRERIRIRGHIRALTAEGRLQAVVLAILPPVMFCVMMVLNPDYTRTLLDHTDLLAAVFVLVLIGFWWINRIVNFDF